MSGIAQALCAGNLRVPAKLAHPAVGEVAALQEEVTLVVRATA
jgi:hypothetical protein